MYDRLKEVDILSEVDGRDEADGAAAQRFERRRAVRHAPVARTIATMLRSLPPGAWTGPDRREDSPRFFGGARARAA
jgi:hypothetical protein